MTTHRFRQRSAVEMIFCDRDGHVCLVSLFGSRFFSSQPHLQRGVAGQRQLLHSATKKVHLRGPTHRRCPLRSIIASSRSLCVVLPPVASSDKKKPDRLKQQQDYPTVGNTPPIPSPTVRNPLRTPQRHNRPPSAQPPRQNKPDSSSSKHKLRCVNFVNLILAFYPEGETPASSAPPC